MWKPIAAVLTAALAVALVPGVAHARRAAPGLSVSQTQNLNRAGQTVTVNGSGFDETKGIYVAFCLADAGTPCAGGVGSGPSSVWISNSPPDYGVGLAVPYGPGGTFSVSVQVMAVFTSGGTTYDCAVVACAVLTRADHTRLGDTSQNVKVRMNFPAAPAPAAPAPPAANPGGGSGGGGSGNTQAAVTTEPSAEPTPGGTATPDPSATASPTPTRSAERTTSVAAVPVSDTGSGTGLWLWWALAAAVVLAAAIVGAVVMGRRRAAAATASATASASARPADPADPA